MTHREIYFAPLEGITGYIYRNAFHSVFDNTETGAKHIDKYFAPFISPGVNQPLSPKELRDIHPDNNGGIALVPQILANNADDFLLAAKYISDLGYEEVNLNLGCPSGTVVAKKKGSGLLADTDMLERMLDKIYEKSTMKVSIKTRIGKDNPNEFPELLAMFNKFPVHQLIIHPRIRTDFYKNKPNMEMYKLAEEKSIHSLCYNGDILTVEDFFRIEKNYPKTHSIMIGRGFLRNPLLAEQIADNEDIRDISQYRNHMAKIHKFHDLLLEGYVEYMSGERPVLFKMKEIWCYMADLFPDSDKLFKKIRKVERLDKYRDIAEEIFRP